jgi:hypothetical protein
MQTFLNYNPHSPSLLISPSFPDALRQSLPEKLPLQHGTCDLAAGTIAS